jgi:MoxR-like ATPase
VNYAAQAADINSEKLVDLLMEAVPAEKHYEQPAA